VDPGPGHQDADQAEDRPEAPTLLAGEDEARGRSRCGGEEVEGAEGAGPPHALDERAEQAQPVHVEGEVQDPAVHERDREQPVDLARGHGRLVEPEGGPQVLAARRLGVERQDDRDPEDRYESGMAGPSPRLRAKARAPESPVSFASQPRRAAISALSAAGARRSASR
jgi:hypothetical protein